VLGTVQGSALRSDRACARPSGLDGACAQMISRHLRDGHRMLFPSGTNCSLIDQLDVIRSTHVCSIVSGRMRFSRLLRFIFRDFDR
jgi:hypothetical protein